jgi:hypothetical protein
MWKLRKTFWDTFSVVKFRANKPRVVPLPAEHEGRVLPVPLQKRYPSIPIANIPVAEHPPADESMRARLLFCKVQAWLYRRFPPTQPGLAPIEADPFAALDKAYTRGHRRCLPAPVLPAEYGDPVDLGHLAVAGPYACYLQRAAGGGYEWDLRHLEKYEHHDGLRKLGTHVQFELDGSHQRLRPVAIECELGVCKPSDDDWWLAQRIALCAATNDLSLVRHFNWVHLATVSQFATVTRNNLPPDHPVRRLLWPHVWGTHYSNELVTEILLMEGGDFEAVFSYTHGGLCQLLADSYERYDVRVIDPVADAERRGILDGGFPLPYLENRQAHFDVMHSHARRYLDLYYGSDDDLRSDAAMRSWADELEQRLPGGMHGLLGDELTVAGVARLIAGFIYLGSVEHEVLGTALWNYQLWSQVQPTRLYRSGQRESIDVYQRLLNYNFILNVRRAPLCQDFSHLALDQGGVEAFQAFLADLERLQERLDREDDACWKVSPKILESGVNG